MQHILKFQGCIKFINGTLIEIYKHNLDHRSWFNGCKKMSCMNNMMFLDHHGLFVYVDSLLPTLLDYIWKFAKLKCKWKFLPQIIAKHYRRLKIVVFVQNRPQIKFSSPSHKTIKKL